MKIEIKLLTTTAVIAACCSAFAVTEWPLEKLKIAAGYLDNDNVRTEKNIREMKECGIDVLVHGRNGDFKTFELFKKYGITTILNGVADRVIQSGPITQKEAYPPAYYELMANKVFKPHEVVTGIDMGDEPPAKSFEYYGEVAQMLTELYPDRFPYFNLYPNYASLMSLKKSEADSQLGTATYDEYVEKYSRHLPLNYICFDHYLPNARPSQYAFREQRYYDNFESVVKVARRTGRKMCIWLLSGYGDNQKVPTAENQLRYQAFTSMAYGTSFICWGCYAGGWWKGQIVDKEGNRTPQYDRLKRVNWEIKSMCGEYDRLRNYDTTIITDKPMESAAFKSIRAGQGGKFVIGKFTGKLRTDPWQALFVAAADDPWDTNQVERVLTFRTSEKFRVLTNRGVHGVPALPCDSAASGVPALPCVTALPCDSAASGVPALPCVTALPHDEYRLTLKSNDAALIITEAKRSERESTGPHYPFRDVYATYINSTKQEGAAREFNNGFFQNLRVTDCSRMKIVDAVAEDEMEHRRAIYLTHTGATAQKPREIRFRAYGKVTIKVNGREVVPTRGFNGEYRFILDTTNEICIVLDS